MCKLMVLVLLNVFLVYLVVVNPTLVFILNQELSLNFHCLLVLLVFIPQLVMQLVILQQCQKYFYFMLPALILAYLRIPVFLKICLSFLLSKDTFPLLAIRAYTNILFSLINLLDLMHFLHMCLALSYYVYTKILVGCCDLINFFVLSNPDGA